MTEIDADDITLYQSLLDREDLQRFAPNSEAMLALELRFSLDDLQTVADDSLTDDNKDHKCDILYVDRETSTAVIAQAYEAQDLTRQNPRANKAADLNTAVSWVLDESVPSSQLGIVLDAAAEDLRAAINSGEISHLEIWFVHNLHHSEQIEHELKRVATTTTSLLDSNFSHNERPEVRTLQVSRDRILAWYRNTNTPIIVPDEIFTPIEGGWIEQRGDGWHAVCTTVPASWLRQLHLNHGDDLFSANVRGPIPIRRSEGNVNYNIAQTAKREPRQFWAYNNGITALVNKIDLPEASDSPDHITIHGIAVVNGAQTTGAISWNKDDDIDGANILARFVESSNSDVIDGIIRFNNSQNPILPSDFRSRDSHQSRLRAEFKKIPDVTYLGTRRGGSQDVPKKPSNYISADTAAQALAAFHGDPSLAYHNKKDIWDKDDKYSKYFGDHTSATHIVMCWSLLKAVQEYKSDLLEREDDLRKTEKKTLAFLRKRGSTFLLVAAIASTLDTIMGKAVSSTFKLSFANSTSPSAAIDHWTPIVSSLATFAPQLDGVDAGTAFRRNTDLSERLTNFQQIVDSVADTLDTKFTTFRAQTALT